MAFYDLTKDERQKLVEKITGDIRSDLIKGTYERFIEYFSDEDTYIRKSGYLAIGKIYKSTEDLHKVILDSLQKLADLVNEKVRQTSVNAAGEIGMTDFECVQSFFDKGLFDDHRAVRNAVIGSIKKMGQKNPKPVLKWSKRYLKHPNKEIRREICHGIELRGRTHPEDILPLLRQLQNDETARVRNTLVHVIGQIAYKKGCLQTVIAALNKWENKELVNNALDEIVDVHQRYRDFAILSQQQAITYIEANYIR